MMIYCLYLPNNVLEKIYNKNALKLLGVRKNKKAYTGRQVSSRKFE
jgi:hypothetical protein